ncbi:MAG: NADH-quinone oxidoreductase subunit A [bacterium]
MIEQYLPIAVMIAGGVIFGIVMVKLNEWFGPKRATEEKLSTYESGMEPIRNARERFSIKFYMVAVLFILFDIEVVFLYPWAVSFRELGLAGFVSMTLFIGILLVGYYYIWRKGALEWD